MDIKALTIVYFIYLLRHLYWTPFMRSRRYHEGDPKIRINIQWLINEPQTNCSDDLKGSRTATKHKSAQMSVKMQHTHKEIVPSANTIHKFLLIIICIFEEFIYSASLDWQSTARLKETRCVLQTWPAEHSATSWKCTSNFPSDDFLQKVTLEKRHLGLKTQSWCNQNESRI